MRFLTSFAAALILTAVATSAFAMGGNRQQMDQAGGAAAGQPKSAEAPKTAAPTPAAPAAAPAPAGAGNTLIIELKSPTPGEIKTDKVVIKLRPDLAPKHVAQIKALATQGFYNGVKWHRVMDGFMAQTGDPTGTGMGGSKLANVPAEFSKESFKRGTVAAARSGDPNSANSQFFICFTDSGCDGLYGQYTIWGQVTEGMQFVDRIKRGAPGSGTVTGPDIMVKVSVQ
jgi:peptidylprolyl isomerase